MQSKWLIIIGGNREMPGSFRKGVGFGRVPKVQRFTGFGAFIEEFT